MIIWLQFSTFLKIIHTQYQNVIIAAGSLTMSGELPNSNVWRTFNVCEGLEVQSFFMFGLL